MIDVNLDRAATFLADVAAVAEAEKDRNQPLDMITYLRSSAPQRQDRDSSNRDSAKSRHARRFCLTISFVHGEANTRVRFSGWRSVHPVEAVG